MRRFLLMIVMAAAPFAAGKTVSVRLVDDLGQPVEGADISIWFKSSRIDRPNAPQLLRSDAQGHVVATGETQVGFVIHVGKVSYYGATTEAPYIPVVDLLERTYVLPRVLDPVPLYAIRELHLKLPVQGVWLGYDFEVNDWVAPYGGGKVADIRFRYSHAFRGFDEGFKDIDAERALVKKIKASRGEAWSEEEFRLDAGKWDGVLDISFSNPQEGIYKEEERFLPYSELKLPHLAPESGYEPTRRYEASTYKGRPPERQAGFFLRTRVKLDANGDIISANYAKIYGDIRFDARGTVSFGYYYNPIPNDRNLEFDRNHNLLPLPNPQSSPSNP
ncbi:MAG: hypothetical protein ACREIA_12160 [Opitutaceae bacterium]